MSYIFTPQADPTHRPYQAPRLATGAVRLLEVILALLAALLGRRHARAWHHDAAHILPDWLDDDLYLPFPEPYRAPLRLKSVHDATHLVCEHPLLWAIGPGPNRGMRRRTRKIPLAPAESARAPPAGPQNRPRTSHSTRWPKSFRYQN